jgi:hypothetical protein
MVPQSTRAPCPGRPVPATVRARRRAGRAPAPGGPEAGAGRTTADWRAGCLADRMIGKVGRVTGTIGPGRLGEVMISIRGGTEAFNAYAADSGETIPTGTRVVVVEYYPPRTVVVSPV